jgi:hypothetical protein
MAEHDGTGHGASHSQPMYCIIFLRNVYFQLGRVRAHDQISHCSQFCATGPI